MTKKKPVRKAARKAARKTTKKPTRARASAPKTRTPRARAAMAGPEPERRYVFRGNATAFSGQLYRPAHIPMGAAGSCLSVALPRKT